jgi:glycosyltransferase involved in cell wall biosynthesis
MAKKKLTVGVFTHDFFPYVGGQGRHVYELYKQNSIYKKVDFIVFSPTKNNLPGHVALFPETLNSKLKNIDFSYKLHRRIKGLIKEYNLDIIHVHGGPGGLFFIKSIYIPVVFTCHHTYWQQSHYIKKQLWKKGFIPFERKGYKKASKVICVSSASQNILFNKYNINKNKMYIIPNGIDFEIFKLVGNNSKNLKDILYVGRIDERKGIKFLIESMPLLKKIDPDIKLHVVGEGKLKNELKQYVSNLQLKVTFHGFLPDKDLNKLYEKIAVQIVPSIFEGFGITVLEAMAKGVPVIATKVDGITDIITSNNNGRLVNYGDKNGLACAISSLILDIRTRNNMVNKGHELLPKYEWEGIYDRTVGIYQSQP